MRKSVPYNYEKQRMPRLEIPDTHEDVETLPPSIITNILEDHKEGEQVQISTADLNLRKEVKGDSSDKRNMSRDSMEATSQQQSEKVAVVDEQNLSIIQKCDVSKQSEDRNISDNVLKNLFTEKR